MRVRQALGLGFASAAGLACFDASVVVGTLCASADDCAGSQTCIHGVCGRCGNDQAEEGEICLGPAKETALGGTFPQVMARAEPGADLARLLVLRNDDVTNNWSLLQLDAVDGRYALTTAGPLRSGSVWAMAEAELDDDNGFELLVVQTNPDVLAWFDQPSPDATLVTIPIEWDFPPTLLTVTDRLADASREIFVSGPGSTSVVQVDPTGEEVSIGVITPSNGLPIVDFAAEDVLAGSGIDLLVQHQNSEELSVFEGSGTFSESKAVAFPRVVSTFSVIEANGDGRQDVVAALDDGSIWLGLGDGAGAFALEQVVAFDDPPASLVVGDPDSDGRPDVLLLPPITSTDTATLLLNRAGSLGQSITLDMPLDPTYARFTNLDGDRVPDLVVGNATGVLSVLTSEI